MKNLYLVLVPQLFKISRTIAHMCIMDFSPSFWAMNKLALMIGSFDSTDLLMRTGLSDLGVVVYSKIDPRENII